MIMVVAYAQYSIGPLAEAIGQRYTYALHMTESFRKGQIGMQIAIVGTGYVGLVTGVCLADVGHTVMCVDTNEDKIKKLKAGIPPIFEPGIEALIKRNIENERISFTTDLAAALQNAECVFIAVGTPQGEDGSADLQYVKNVARDVGRLAARELVVIVKSTVPVGTCDVVEQVLKDEVAKRGVAFPVHVASNPEFLKEGTAIDDFMHPDRIVAGASDPFAENILREIYKPYIVDDPNKLFLMDKRSSELTKYAANAMLATRISFMNEIARLCEKVGANVDNIRLGMGADPRIGRKFLYAGPGFGGSCFPKDVAALRKTGKSYGVTLEVLEAVNVANEAQKLFVAQKVVSHYKAMVGLRVAVWGLAFKPGTDDCREAPAKTIIEELLKAGAAVVAHDPEGESNFRAEIGERAGLTYAKSAYDAVKGADGVVLVTEWSEYKRPNWDKIGGMMRKRAVFDLRNQYVGETLRKAGFYYECVGRPNA